MRTYLEFCRDTGLQDLPSVTEALFSKSNLAWLIADANAAIWDCEKSAKIVEKVKAMFEEDPICWFKSPEKMLESYAIQYLEFRELPRKWKTEKGTLNVTITRLIGNGAEFLKYLSEIN